MFAGHGVRGEADEAREQWRGVDVQEAPGCSAAPTAGLHARAQLGQPH